MAVVVVEAVLAAGPLVLVLVVTDVNELLVLRAAAGDNGEENDPARSRIAECEDISRL